MLETYATNLKKSYLKPFIIFLIILIILFNSVMIYSTNIWNDIPIYLYITYAIWMVFNLIIFKQDSFDNIKVSKASAIRYLIINVISGYLQPIAVASCYLIGIVFTPWSGIIYWMNIIGAVLLSVVAISIFSINEFHIVVDEAKTSLNLLAILIKLASLGWLAYLAMTVPTTAEENSFIWVSILFLLCIDLLILRSFLNYALFMDELRNGPYKMESHQSNDY
ncbi:DUF5079 family protein [Staphylococcus agnetis]|uniref:DUF5079 family protein n=1 Tax=Staphylococcus agnetis TaxID=985762 RepID=UPI000CD2F3A0|nr:DUF5079 family protein [Staphylococcus agnetis]MBY7665499.1 DUF5079 family protein [Staphylococcus agnetis]NJH66665.1 DUF5079 family protein [Staphylococcus agnetis]NJH78284.1 DUF5079 family protein [Staphylococcus agnetis]PNY85579.1 hypothetical protein CD172_07380 [Staphylococcus agnetis]PTH67033.1 DUF5079 domain-containing protein [Staphylococcus agnetis]